MVVLKPIYSFFANNLLFTLITAGVIGTLFGPDIKDLFNKILRRKTCPHCGARMELIKRDGKKYWSCSQCQVKLRADKKRE